MSYFDSEKDNDPWASTYQANMPAYSFGAQPVAPEPSIAAPQPAFADPPAASQQAFPAPPPNFAAPQPAFADPQTIQAKVRNLKRVHL